MLNKNFLHILPYFFHYIDLIFSKLFARAEDLIEPKKIYLKVIKKIGWKLKKQKNPSSFFFRLVPNSNTSKNKMHSIFTYIIKWFIFFHFFLKKKAEIEEKVRSRLEARNPQRSNCERSRTCSSCSNFCQQWKNRVQCRWVYNFGQF